MFDYDRTLELIFIVLSSRMKVLGFWKEEKFKKIIYLNSKKIKKVRE